MLSLCLISESTKADAAALRLIARALEENLKHAWLAWRPYLAHWIADAPPVVVQWDDEPLPPWAGAEPSRISRAVPLYFVDALSRNPKTLAVHYVQGNRPAARVYVDAATGLNTGRGSVMELAGHEAIEVMGNPWVDLWEIVPGRPNVLTPRELCDAVQDTYESVSRDSEGRRWQLANFLHPVWFGLPSAFGATFRADHKGTLTEPGAIGPEGYLVVRDDDWNVSHEFGARYSGDRSPGRVGKVEGRTRAIVRGCVLAQINRVGLH